MAERRPLTGNEIAIIGMGGRFPRARNVDEFWKNLRDGVEGTSTITADDLQAIGVDPAVLKDPDYVSDVFAIDEADGFDAEFFGYSPREAEMMDPQQRMFLETCWTALEHAGYDSHRYPGLIGVFGGVGRNSYYLHAVGARPELLGTSGDYSTLIGNERDFPTMHVSHKLNLRGPSVDVQTACSTSGVAVHLACQSLRAGDCDIALAGGCKIVYPNREGYWYVEGGPLAPEGHIRAFDADAKGMVRGSGCAILVLKRLEDALADGDAVYAVVLGSAVNNDGAARAGFTAPTVSGQAAVIAEAHSAAGVTADQISYVETHGTGTVLGDPIEVRGLTEAFRQTTDKSQFCAIGSVKTNIGHLDAGATAAGIVKATLALLNEALPPSLNYKRPNPQIDFAHSPFFVNDRLRPWPRGAQPRRAGVSSFGLGGTNAHVILEEAPAPVPSAPTRSPQVLVLSAKSADALDTLTGALAGLLRDNPGVSLADVGYTLQQGRREWAHRRAIVASTASEAIELLEERRSPAVSGGAASLAFVFPGIEAQPRCLPALAAHYPPFAAAIDECVEAAEPARRAALRAALAREGKDASSSSAATAQALCAFEYALASLWSHFGLSATAFAGHGAGEYVAACLAGVLSLSDAFALAAARGELLEGVKPSALVPLPEPGLHELVDECTTLHVLAATGADAGALAAFEALARRITWRAPRAPLLSGMTGTWMTAQQATDAEHWIAQLRRPVRFTEALTALLQDDSRVLLEVGPGHHLTSFAQAHPVLRASHHAIPSLAPGGDARAGFLRSLGELWTSGLGIDWLALHDGAQRRRVALPTYPFQRKRYALVSGAKASAATPLAHRQAVPEPVPSPAVAPAVAAQPAPFQPASMTATAAPQPRSEKLVAELRRILNDLSGIDAARIDENATFVELGFDSLFLAEANSAFKKRFTIRLTTRHLLEKTPTVRALATFLDAELPADFFPPETAPTPAASVPTSSAAAAAPAALANLAIPMMAGVPPVGPGPLEALIAQQMQLMHAQLAALRAATSGTTAPAVAQPVVPTAARTEAPAPAAPAIPDTSSPWQPVAKSAGETELTSIQRAHLAALTARVLELTPRSKALTQENRAALSDPRTVQGFRKQWKEIVYPVVSERAQGSRIWDVDGNEYIDLVSGYGVTFFGHSPKFITDAVAEQLTRTVAIGPQSPLAGEVAKLVCELTGHERAAFCNTGSEAVLAAIRMARTVTGKTKIATFAGHYHGIFDEVLVKGVGSGAERRTVPTAPGIPAHAVGEVVVMEYDNPASLDVIRKHANDLALVMVEPVRSRNLDKQPKEFLKALRAVTEELGIPLLFDEMITGFRSHPGGAQAIFGVQADLATYGKVIGGGFPIGVVAGKSRFLDALDGGMWRYGDDSAPEADMTWFAGTFVRHPLALAAARAALTHLRNEGPQLQEGLNRRTRRFVDDLNAHFRATNTPIHIEQFASSFFVSFPAYQEYSALLFFHLRNRGIYTYEGRPAFFTLAHTDADLSRISAAFKESVAELQGAGFLAGGTPRTDEIRTVDLAEGQQEIWLATRFGEDASRAFNLASTLRLRGPLRVEALNAAVQRLVERHEALRALPNEDGLTQRILPKVTLDVPHIDLSALPQAERERKLHELREAQVETSFDLAAGPLARAILIKLAADDHYFVIAVHHIVCDGWSCGVLLRDIGKLYEAECLGRAPELRPVMQLSEFAAASLENRQSSERAEAEEYWLGEFTGRIPTLQLPTDRPRPPKKTFRAKRITLPLTEELVVRAKALAAAQGSTLFSTLLAGFGALMHRLSGQDDIVIGFSLAGQSAIPDRDLVGHCVTFLPLRLRPSSEQAFGEFVQTVRGKVLDALEHQNVAFGGLLRRLRIARDPSRVPLMSVAFNLDPSGRKLQFHDLHADNGSVGRRYENFDIFFNVVELGGNNFEIQVTFNLDLFDEQTMWTRLAEYTALLETAAANPAVRLMELPVTASVSSWTGGTTESARTASEAPTSTTDGVIQVVMTAWREVLGLRDIPLDGDFFEMGGHSLLGAQVITRLRDRLGIELTLGTLFEAPTVAQLTRRIEALQYLQSTSTPVTAEREVVEL